MTAIKSQLLRQIICIEDLKQPDYPPETDLTAVTKSMVDLFSRHQNYTNVLVEGLSGYLSNGADDLLEAIQDIVAGSRTGSNCFQELMNGVRVKLDALEEREVIDTCFVSYFVSAMMIPIKNMRLL